VRLFHKKEVYFDEYNEYDDNYEEEIEYDMNRLVTIVNIVFTILIVLMTMITIDVISVSRYSKGPFFAIKTHTYKDGGTKVYYGIGYKVIKYNATNGRKDKAIGSWNLKYNIKPINYNIVDLAIDLTNYPQKTYTIIGNEFIKIKGEIFRININKKQVVIKYTDKDNSKYNLNIICTQQNSINNIEVGEKVTLVGTVKDFYLGNDKTPNKLYINHCIKK